MTETSQPPPIPSPPAAAAHARRDRASDSRDLVWLVLPGTLWGASFLFIAEALQAVGPFGIGFLRILAGFVTLSLWPAARGVLPRAAYGRVAALGVVWLALPLTFFGFAERTVSSALTGLLNGATPIFAAAVAAGIARRLPSRTVIAGLAVGLSGCVLAAWPSLGDGSRSSRGLGWILAALVCYGFAFNLARPLQQSYGALPVLRGAMVVALALTAPLGLRDALAGHWSARPIAALAALGILGTGVAYVAVTTAAGRFGATRAASTTFLIPPVALLLGVLVRGESVAALSVVGGALCLAGAAWIRRGERPRVPAGR